MENEYHGKMNTMARFWQDLSQDCFKILPKFCQDLTKIFMECQPGYSYKTHKVSLLKLRKTDLITMSSVFLTFHKQSQAITMIAITTYKNIL